MEISKKERQSNIELLRIISMVLIVAHHFSVHGGFVFDTTTVTLNECWLMLLQMGGKIGVDVFILISGYFLVNSDKANIKKIVMLALQILTYSLLTYVIGIIFKIEPFNKAVLLKHLFPITRGLWWFPTAYVVVYLFSPYINKAIKSLTKKEFQNMMILSFIIWSVLPTIIKDNPFSNTIIWFIFVYIIGAYIRLYPVKYKDSETYIVLAIALSIVLFIWSILFDILGINYKFFAVRSTLYYGQQTVPIIIISILLFLGFINMNIKSSKIINTIAKTTFGIYLIHDSRYGRLILWNKIFKNSTYLTSKYLIPYSIMVIIIVFVVCALIDFIRSKTLEKIYSNIIDRIERRIHEKQKRIKRNNHKSAI